MARTEVIPFREFVRGEWQPKKPLQIIVEHIDRHKVVYTIAGLTLTASLTGFVDFAHATPDYASVIDQKGNYIYGQLVRIGKWVIVCKGAFDILKSLAESDMIGARKNFFVYLLVYLLLLALPKALGVIDGLFEETV